MSEETKKKIGDAQRGEKNHMYNRRGKDNPSSMKVYNETDDIYYDSATMCSQETGISISKICAVCRGERATAGNKVFRYVVDGKIQYPNTKVKRKTKRVIYNKDKKIYESIKEACIEVYGYYDYHRIKKELDKPNGEFSYYNE